MSVEVKIPAVGESISSGVVSVWHKKSGEFVNAGDALFTLETDKVSTEIAAEKAGLLETLVPEGQEVKIGETVATIDGTVGEVKGDVTNATQTVAEAAKHVDHIIVSVQDPIEKFTTAVPRFSLPRSAALLQKKRSIPRA